MADPVAAVADAIEEEVEDRVEVAEAVAAAAIEGAEERVEAANEMAQQIALAALQTEVGNRVSSLAQEVEKWPANLAAMESRIMTALETRLAAPPVVVIPPTPEGDLLTPPAPLAPEVAIVDPLTGQTEVESEPIASERKRVTYL